ncbi:MAG: hypothetical protein KC421_24105 [Anaerolineales bacterium]|nr:hypothetical protein [Anaerolineales bacterium]
MGKDSSIDDKSTEKNNISEINTSSHSLGISLDAGKLLIGEAQISIQSSAHEIFGDYASVKPSLFAESFSTLTDGITLNLVKNSNYNFLERLGIDVAKPYFFSEGTLICDFGIADKSPLISAAFVMESPINSIAESVLTIKDSIITDSPNSILLAGENRLLNLETSGFLSLKDNGTIFNSEPISSAASILSSTNWLQIGDGLGMDILGKTIIQDNLLSASDAIVTLAETILPSSALFSLSVSEYQTHANLVHHTTKSFHDYAYQELETSSESSMLVEKLSRLDHGFVNMLVGASRTLQSENPEKVRHFSISSRELLTHVMHTLSPDDDVRSWSSSESDFHNGKPTRRARLKYICRRVNEGSFEKFLDADIKATLEFFDLLQSGTHGTRPRYTDSQLRVMLSRMMGTLNFILDVSDLE